MYDNKLDISNCGQVHGTPIFPYVIFSWLKPLCSLPLLTSQWIYRWSNIIIIVGHHHYKKHGGIGGYSYYRIATYVMLVFFGTGSLVLCSLSTLDKFYCLDMINATSNKPANITLYKLADTTEVALNILLIIYIVMLVSCLLHSKVSKQISFEKTFRRNIIMQVKLVYDDNQVIPDTFFM